jgi:hypothetical protein
MMEYFGLDVSIPNHSNFLIHRLTGNRIVIPKENPIVYVIYCFPLNHFSS